VKTRARSFYIADVGSNDAYYKIREALIGAPVQEKSLSYQAIEKAMRGEMQSCVLSIEGRHFRSKLSVRPEKYAGCTWLHDRTVYFAEVLILPKKTKADTEYDKYDQS
jgi:hypothetical protein